MRGSFLLFHKSQALPREAGTFQAPDSNRNPNHNVYPANVISGAIARSNDGALETGLFSVASAP